jgi:hypothetical protein
MWGDWLVGSLALTAAKLDHDWIRPALTGCLPTRVTTALYSCTRGLFLSALARGQFEPVTSPPGASRRVMGLLFRNDLGNAAGLDKDGMMLEWFWRSGAGFCVVGTVLDSPHTGNNWIFGSFCPWLPLPGAGNGLNSLGLPSKGVQKALDNISRFRAGHSEEELRGFPIGLSVMGHPAKHGDEKLQGVLECVRKACAVVDFIELNESCPNVDHGKPSVAELEERLAAVSHDAHVTPACSPSPARRLSPAAAEEDSRTGPPPMPPVSALTQSGRCCLGLVVLLLLLLCAGGCHLRRWWERATKPARRPVARCRC